MAGEIEAAAYGSGLTLYAVVRDATGRPWNTNTLAFEAFTAGNYAQYGVALTEQTGSGYYVGDFPAGIVTRGQYTIVVRVQAGGVPAEGDGIAATGIIAWTGSAEQSIADLLTSAAYTAPDNVGIASAEAAAASAATTATEIAGDTDTLLTGQAVQATATAVAVAQTAITAIDTVTSQLRFTIANQVDANALTGGGGGLTPITTGTAQAGAAGSITLAGGASAVTDFYLATRIDITGGAGAGQSRTIIAYNGTSKAATVDRAWDVTPDATSVYAVQYSDQPGTRAGATVMVPYNPAGVTLSQTFLAPNQTDSNQPGVLNLQIVRGTDFSRDIVAVDATGTPIDLTGAAIELLCKRALTDPDDVAVLAMSTGSAGGISIITPLAGLFRLSVPNVADVGINNQSLFLSGIPYAYAAKIWAGSQEIVSRGSITILQDAVLGTTRPT